MVDELDAFLRHQVYVEGYKNGQTEDTATFEQIAAVILLLVTKTGYENFGDMPRRVLSRLIAQVNAKVKELYGKRADLTMSNLRKFMDVDLKVTRKLFSEISGEPVGVVAGALLWAELLNAPMATGIEPKRILTGVLAATLAELGKLMRRAYADKWTRSEFTKALVGTRTVSGAITKAQRQFNTGVNTLIQHTTSYVVFKVGSLRYDRYQWVSVLDSRTTEICRSRNGQLFTYRQGPRPPAHWGCRSTIIPVVMSARLALPTYFTWLTAQPATVQIDILGQRRANELRAGRLRADDLESFDGIPALNLDDYEARLASMVA